VQARIKPTVEVKQGVSRVCPQTALLLLPVHPGEQILPCLGCIWTWQAPGAPGMCLLVCLSGSSRLGL